MLRCSVSRHLCGGGVWSAGLGLFVGAGRCVGCVLGQSPWWGRRVHGEEGSGGVSSPVPADLVGHVLEVCVSEYIGL